MTVQTSRLIKATPAEVWNTLTSPDGMKAFMMGADVETDWRVGHPIRMRGEFQGRAYEDHGEVRSFEPCKSLSYTHERGAQPGQAHLVTFQLAPRQDHTEVTVTQELADGGDRAADEKNAAQYEKTWAGMLARLEKAVSA